MTVALLKAEVKKRINNSKLISLTNETPSSSINETVLDSACADAIGEFQLITGLAHDTANLTHVTYLVAGVIYFLEYYKSREGQILSMHGKRFYRGCKEIREKLTLLPISNSEFANVYPSTPQLPDMSRYRNVFDPSADSASTTVTDVNPGN